MVEQMEEEGEQEEEEEEQVELKAHRFTKRL